MTPRNKSTASRRRAGGDDPGPGPAGFKSGRKLDIINERKRKTTDTLTDYVLKTST